jgi:hypothetical protein
MEFFRISGGLRGEGGIREGNRGGLGLFKWDDIKQDQQKECYLGNSVKASTGRWQKHKSIPIFTYRFTLVFTRKARNSKTS